MITEKDTVKVSARKYVLESAEVLTNRQETKQPEPFVYASLIFEAYSIESNQQAKTTIQISYIVVDGTRLRGELASGARFSRGRRSSIGNENEDICGSYERSHAQNADQLDLKQARHDEGGYVGRR